MRPKKALLILFSVIAGIGFSGCATWADKASTTRQAVTLDALFTVKAAGDRSVVRAITRAALCPEIVWAGGRRERMSIRAAAAVVPLRGDSVQNDSKPANFDALTCEAEWSMDAVGAMVEGRAVPAPRQEIRRIVLIGDTGCRMKASEKAFQDCNDGELWPFAQVARSAAAMNPDLVVHVGDIHYRESPCPAGNTGCAGSPWGYGMDAWRADLFEPAAPLLAAAPWLFVRGNHESCFRAGQGWFRFVDPDAWTNARSCNSPASDHDADFSEPYAVRIGTGVQFIVFDSSKSSGKPYASTDAAFAKYASEMRQVSRLADQAPHNFFFSHHPLLAFAPLDGAGGVKPGGSRGLQTAFASVNPVRLFPDKVDVVMHGHIHLFEAIGFSSAHPASLILGNSGSTTEGHAPAAVAIGSQAYVGAHVDDYASRSEFGFAVMDRIDGLGGAQWRVTEYDAAGHPKIVCELQGAKSRCSHVD